MNSQNSESASNIAGFVGASFGGADDQTQCFLAEQIWEVKNPTDKESALVRSMQPGERIAIKVSYAPKRDMPLDIFSE